MHSTPIGQTASFLTASCAPLRWWADCAAQWNGVSAIRPITDGDRPLVLHTDASGSVGAGAALFDGSRPRSAAPSPSGASDIFQVLRDGRPRTRAELAQITGISVAETVPDSILETADEVELVDLPPNDLIERLRCRHWGCHHPTPSVP